MRVERTLVTVFPDVTRRLTTHLTRTAISLDFIINIDCHPVNRAHAASLCHVEL